MRAALLVAVLACVSCATTAAEYPSDASSPHATPTTNDLVPACTATECGLYRLRDLRSVQLARGAPAAVRQPSTNAPQRNWGSGYQWHPTPEPSFEIHWYRREPLPSEEEAERRYREWRRRPKERHHIFPQAFADYFRGRGINVHEWTLLMDAAAHQELHKLAGGGPWNTEWLEFRRRTKGQATRQAHYDHASYLMAKYKMWGIPMTYWQQFDLPPLPPHASADAP
ncbi:TIGR02269 family lipoprotein (plasmid) [Myxococcus stipitatus]